MSNVRLEILKSLNRQVLNQLDLAKSVDHPGESGRARENLIVDFFRRFLPASFGISTGFVIDALGNISRQIDIVIYRTDYHPVFEIGGIKHFLIESVAVVLENKSSIATNAALTQALENIKSVKSLDRTNGGKNYRVVGTQKGPNVDPSDYRDQVFGAIVTEKSLSDKSLRTGLLTFMHSNPPSHWPNFYADLRHLAVEYRQSGPSEPLDFTRDPQKAKALAFLKPQKDSDAPPLVLLGSMVADFLRVTPLVDYSAIDYFGSGFTISSESWSIS